MASKLHKERLSSAPQEPKQETIEQCHENSTKQTSFLIKEVSLYDRLQEWRRESLNNWRCVVANIRYLLNHRDPSKMTK